MAFHLQYILAALPVILLSLALHEFGHAAMADKLGDPTPRSHGRLTLNPLKHLDPLGTIMIVVSMLSGFVIGWAKPVQTNPRYYPNYRRGTLLVALAGPMMNACLAMLGLGFAYILFMGHNPPAGFGLVLLQTLIIANLALLLFNLLPIPPLDGGNVLYALLDPATGERYRRIAPYGLLILFGLFYLMGGLLQTGFMLGLHAGVALLLGPGFATWLLGF